MLQKLLLFLFFCPSLFAAELPPLEQAHSHFQVGEYERAIDLFERAIREPDTELAAQLGLSRVLLETGKYERARNILEKAVEKYQRAPDALALLGQVCELSGQYDKARALYLEAINKAPDQWEARLALGKMLWQWGEKTLARETLHHFLTYYSTRSELTAIELRFIAEACIYLDRFRDANHLFFEATQGDDKLWQAFVPWGELMLSKYNMPDAQGIFQDALKINPNCVAANLGLAKCAKFSPLQQPLVEQVLDINGHYVPAYDFLAEQAVLQGEFEESLEHVERALEVNVNSLTSRTWRAVALYLMNDMKGFQDEETKILSINPRYGELYYQIAEVLTKRYLFAESVQFYHKAIELDPEHWLAYAGLGTSLSRLGREVEAKRKLELAFNRDPYSKLVGNLLTLFDEFPEYKTHKTRYLTVRIHGDDDPVLSPYATELADAGFENLLNLYPVSTDEEVIVEMFPSHDDFAVRCFGLPGAQAFLGICFGNVVAMDSPRARSKGDFVWGETLWHELVHVTHLRLTANRIPRWLAEGIAVFETSLSKPYWSMNLDWPFILAFQNDRLLPLKELDSGFNRPSEPGQVTLSYFQASLIVEYMVETFGRSKLHAMFPKFKDGLKTPEVIEAVFGKDVDRFDADFRAFVEEKYRLAEIDYDYDAKEFEGDSDKLGRKLAKAISRKPNNPFVSFRYGLYFKEQADYGNAIDYLKRAKSQFPQFVDKENNPYQELANIYIEMGDNEEAISELQQLTSLNAKDGATLKLLGRLSIKQGDHQTAIEALRKALYISPFDSEIHRQLAQAFVAAGQLNSAIAELQINLLTNPQDMAGAHCELANVYLQAGMKNDAKKSALSALEIAPGYERAQEILLATIE